LSACKKDDIYEKYAEEEKKLAEYILDTYGSCDEETVFCLDRGAYLIKTVIKQDSVLIEAGNHIIWNRTETNQITGIVEYTSEISDYKFVDSYVYGGPEITMVLESIIDKGLAKMKKGEKGKLYISSYWYYSDFEPRIIDVEIVDVIKRLPEYQNELMFENVKKICKKGAYVDTIKNILSTSDNTKDNIAMYYIIDTGKGDRIIDGMIVNTRTSISYSIQDDIIQPYTIGQNQAWNVNKISTSLTSTNFMGEVFKKMRKGGRVVVAMPSKLYWDDEKLPTSVNEYGQFFIPRWSVVVFTITIN